MCIFHLRYFIFLTDFSIEVVNTVFLVHVSANYFFKKKDNSYMRVVLFMDKKYTKQFTFSVLD